jgi:HEAT repeat protein
VLELAALQKPAAVPLLVRALKDPEVEVRAATAWGLLNYNDARVAAGLRETLNDDDDRVRASAVWALSHIGGKAVLPDVVRLATNDASGVVRFRAVWGLALIRDKSALPIVINALGDYNTSVRERSALIALEALADNTVVSRVLTQTNNVLPATRRVVMYLLARYGDKSVVPALKQALTDPDQLVRAEAALSLGKLKARDALANLLPLLADPDEHIRGSVAHAVGLIGDKSAIEALRPALEDKSAFVRAVAAESLQKLGDKTVKPPAGFKAAELFTFPIYKPEHEELYR